MAILIPDTPLGPVRPEVARVHRLLKQLPDEGFAVWQRLTLHAEPGPDFWVLTPGRQAAWIKVSGLAAAGARTFLQLGLFDIQAGRPADAEHQALLRFARAHPIPSGAGGGDAPGPFEHVPALVLFPNLSQADLDQLRPLAHLPPGLSWAGRETLAGAQFAAWLRAHLGPPLEADSLAALRQAFTPEVVIPAPFSVRKPPERGTAAATAPLLLDYDQERVLKGDLDLPAEAQGLVRDFGLRLVNGVAGSGKSLLIVYRARLLRQLYPDRSILVLTHNRPLIHDLKARYRALGGPAGGVEWLTFNQWCRRLWPRGQRFREPLGHSRRLRLVRDVWHRHLANTSLSEQALLSELDWCKDQLIFSRQAYLAADRSGRIFGLSEAQRQQMYDAFDAYQAELNRLGRMDWGDVPRQLWRWLEAGRLPVPQFDVILVDEAQFFAPLWFELIKRALKPGLGQLFLAADATQGFLQRRQSWAALGLDVRGRTHRLKKSYRTTREILSFATLLYRNRVPADEDDIVAPDLAALPPGIFPDIIPLTSGQDEITRVVNEIAALVAQGVPRRHILAIHADWEGRDQLHQRLEQKLGAGSAVDPKSGLDADAVRVCTLNAVTGLESPIVFLVGVRALFEQEQSLRLSDAERADMVRDNSRKLYMALTRAGQRVVLTYVGELPDELQQAGAR